MGTLWHDGGRERGLAAWNRCEHVVMVSRGRLLARTSPPVNLATRVRGVIPLRMQARTGLGNYLERGCAEWALTVQHRFVYIGSVRVGVAESVEV